MATINKIGNLRYQVYALTKDGELKEPLTEPLLTRERANKYFSDCAQCAIVSINEYGSVVEILEKSKYYEILPAWSLAALLDVLPNEIITDNMFECHYQIDIRKYGGGNNTTLYQIAYGNNRGLSGSWHDMINTGEKESLIDCCVAMIEKLHELKML